ncbi:unnamed protein product, partial [Toxocara canis]|uniref:Uncharacterized protein n=1 Tax=Toxocara canis TaxID=6265 RepID=A0A183U974_TOXCA
MVMLLQDPSIGASDPEMMRRSAVIAQKEKCTGFALLSLIVRASAFNPMCIF